jgi:hypothetical protein
MATSKLGTCLVEHGWLSEAQLWRALELQRARGGRLGTVLLEQNLVPEGRLLEALAVIHQAETIGLGELRDIPAEVLKLVPPKVALRLQVVPFRMAGARVHVAAKDPASIPALDELSFVTGKRVQLFAVPELRVDEALAAYYGKALSARMRQAVERVNSMAPVAPPAPAAEPSGLLDATEPLAEAPPAAIVSSTGKAKVKIRSAEVRGTREVSPVAAPPSLSGNLPSSSTESSAPIPPIPPIPEAPRPSRANPATARRARSNQNAAEAAEDAEAQRAATRATAPVAALAEPGADADKVFAAGTAALLAAAAAREGNPIPVPEAAPEAPQEPPAAAPAEASEASEAAASTAAVLAPPPPPPKRLVVALNSSQRARLRENEDEEKQAASPRAERDRIAEDLVETVRKSLDRVLLFRVRGDELEGWVASDEIEPEALRAFKARFGELPLFLGLQQGSRFYLGPLPPMGSHRRLAALWGGELPRDGVALPVRLGERLVAILYGDRGRTGLSGVSVADLEAAVATAERAFENAITRGKRSAS